MAAVVAAVIGTHTGRATPPCKELTIGWNGHLDVRYRFDAAVAASHDPTRSSGDPVGRAASGTAGGAMPGTTSARSRHSGPLRVLQSLYPEGPAVCHHVLVHPPGGIAGGDTLNVALHLAAGSHALITTPGATRFYRSSGDTAVQGVQAVLEPASRLEWLPLETIVHDGARSENHAVFDLQGDARLIAWDVLALGLPASDAPFLRGRHVQRWTLPGVWLDHAAIDAADLRLLQSPLGWAGHTVLATAVAAAGVAVGRAAVESMLDAARAVLSTHALASTAGATALADERGVVVRVLAPRVEPALGLLRAVWSAWRPLWIGRAGIEPRLWRL